MHLFSILSHLWNAPFLQMNPNWNSQEINTAIFSFSQIPSTIQRSKLSFKILQPCPNSAGPLHGHKAAFQNADGCQIMDSILTPKSFNRLTIIYDRKAKLVGKHFALNMPQKSFAEIAVKPLVSLSPGISWNWLGGRAWLLFFLRDDSSSSDTSITTVNVKLLYKGDNVFGTT